MKIINNPFLKKINGFTLYELIIAIIFTSFVVIIAYSAHRIILSQSTSYRNTEKSLSEVLIFDFLITHYFSEAEIIKRYNNKIIFKFPTKENEEIEILDDFILRKSLKHQTDTFFLRNKLFETSFKNQTVSSGVLDGFDLKVFFFERELHLKFQKEYSSYFDIIDEEK